MYQCVECTLGVVGCVSQVGVSLGVHVLYQAWPLSGNSFCPIPAHTFANSHVATVKAMWLLSEHTAVAMVCNLPRWLKTSHSSSAPSAEGEESLSIADLCRQIDIFNHSASFAQAVLDVLT